MGIITENSDIRVSSIRRRRLHNYFPRFFSLAFPQSSSPMNFRQQKGKNGKIIVLLFNKSVCVQHMNRIIGTPWHIYFRNVLSNVATCEYIKRYLIETINNGPSSTKENKIEKKEKNLR